MWKRLFRPKPQSRPAITIVSGLPRSGTSMMMRMLAAGGMPILTDHQRQADADNPYGYYELEAVKNIQEDPSFLEHAHGKAFKMVSPLLYHLPKDKRYKVIFMRRNLKEILASQQLMLQRRGKTPPPEEDAHLEHLFQKHLHEIEAWLGQQAHIEVLYVDYNAVIRDPAPWAQAVNRFLGGGLDVESMAASVDTTLYRNRV